MITKFEDGKQIAGVIIIKCLFHASRQKDTRYLIRRVCCGEEKAVLTHERILERVRTKKHLCQKCSRKKKRGRTQAVNTTHKAVRDTDGVPFPAWEVPPSVANRTGNEEIFPDD